MSLARELYDQHIDDTPPAWLDSIFVLITAIIHTLYIFKFTSFSLGYLHAKL